MIKLLGFIMLILVVTPVLIFFCVKYGTVGFYKAKEFIKREQKQKS